MKTNRAAIRVSIAAVLLAAAACRRDESPDATTPAASPTVTAPAEWAGRSNPLPDDAATISRGRAQFLANCAPCHGPEADGKGVASIGLTPPPANFRDGKRLSHKGDDVLFWRISTGVVGSAMPAFAGTISEEDRWAILRFLRSLPGAERATPAAQPDGT